MKKGQLAPDFSLNDKDGRTHALSEMNGKYKVVYFYPKDDTPGCTMQAKGYTKSLSMFKKLGAEVVGISGGDEKTKSKFCTKHRLKVLLLSDPDFKVAKRWGAYGDKVFMGRKYKGIFRNTYLLDENGKVLEVFEKVDPENDPSKLIEAIKSVANGKTKSVKKGKVARGKVAPKATRSTKSVRN